MATTLPKSAKYITVEIRKQIKKDKKGHDFFSVKTSIGEWLMCYDTEMYDTLSEGFKGEVVVETNGDFKKIIDVAIHQEDVSPAVPLKEEPKQETQLDRIEKKVDDIFKAVGLT